MLNGKGQNHLGLINSTISKKEKKPQQKLYFKLKSPILLNGLFKKRKHYIHLKDKLN